MKARTDSSPTISCPTCGADNRLGVPFCTVCGNRIYQGSEAPPKVKRKTRGGLRRAVRNGAIALLILWILGSISLLFWPFPPLTRARVDQTASTARQLVDQSHRALETGEPVPSTKLREGQWNAYIREAYPGDDRQLSVYMTRGKLVMVADEKTGPFQIGTRLVLTENEDEDGVRVESLWIGHLPLPRFLAAPWTRALSRRFDLGLDNRLWGKMAIHRIETNAVILGEATGDAP